MFEDERSHYCLQCSQEKSAKHFTSWIADKSAAMKCDHCLDKKSQQERMILQAKERKAKQVHMDAIFSPTQRGLSKKAEAIELCAKRKALAEKLDLDLIDKEFDL